MAYLLALDQGTTSSRAMVFDADGRVAAFRHGADTWQHRQTLAPKA